MTMKKIIVIFGVCFLAGMRSSGQGLTKGEHFASVNGLRLHYYVAGKGPVCLLPSPGFGLAVNYLIPLKALEQYFTMVYYDTRGSGKSSGPMDPMKYGLSDMTDDMDSLRTYLGLSRVWVAGHAGGGYIVLNYGIHYNNRLNGMILIAPVAVFDSVHNVEAHRLLLKRKEVPSLSGSVDIALGRDSIHRAAADRFSICLPLYFHDAAKAQRFLQKNILINDSTAAYTGKSALFSGNLVPELYRVTVPVFIIEGDDDCLIPLLSDATRIQKHIASSTLVIIKDCGHFPWLEKPVEFSKVCDNWLKIHG